MRAKILFSFLILACRKETGIWKCYSIRTNFHIFLPGRIYEQNSTLPHRSSFIFEYVFYTHRHHATMLNNLHAKYKFEASVLTINAIIIYTTQSARLPKNGAHRGRYLSLSQQNVRYSFSNNSSLLRQIGL